MNININRSGQRGSSQPAKPRKTRLAQSSKYCRKAITARVAAMRPNLLAVYGEGNGSTIPLINAYRRKLCRWCDIEAPQKIVVATSAMLSMKSSGFDVLALSFHLSSYYKKMIKLNLKRGEGSIPESISNCLKSCLRSTVFGDLKDNSIYLFFVLEDLWLNPHGHGCFLVPSNWRKSDRDRALLELEVAVKKAVCHRYRRRGTNKAVHISESYQAGDIAKPVNLGWATYIAKERPQKVYISSHLSPIVRKYHEALRTPISLSPHSTPNS